MKTWREELRDKDFTEYVKNRMTFFKMVTTGSKNLDKQLKALNNVKETRRNESR